MGLAASPHDPCLFTGRPRATSDKPSYATATASPSAPIYAGVYVDDFVYFSDDPAVELEFERLLQEEVKTDFMGPVDWFLGTSFDWKRHGDGELSVHLSQAAYARNLAERYRQHDASFDPSATPYRSGLPIDSIKRSKDDPTDPEVLRRTETYMSINGSLNWLATNTRPELSPIVSFLASYNRYPSKEHLKAALYTLRYVNSTHEYGISFHSKSPAAIQSFVHHPFDHDVEAYSDARPPQAHEFHELTSFCDACWGSQLGNSVPEGTEIDLFKLRSMAGYIVFRAGGPVSWKSFRIDRTSLSSCEAEIKATNECAKDTLSIRLRCGDLGLNDEDTPTPIFNDNQGAVDWCKSTTTKGMKHVNLRENAVRECIVLKELTVHHVAGKLNPADIFTKELRDSAHFRRLRDSFMSTRSQFHKLVGYKCSNNSSLKTTILPSPASPVKEVKTVTTDIKRVVTWDSNLIHPISKRAVVPAAALVTHKVLPSSPSVRMGGVGSGNWTRLLNRVNSRNSRNHPRGVV